MGLPIPKAAELAHATKTECARLGAYLCPTIMPWIRRQITMPQRPHGLPNSSNPDLIGPNAQRRCAGIRLITIRIGLGIFKTCPMGSASNGPDHKPVNTCSAWPILGYCHDARNARPIVSPNDKGHRLAAPDILNHERPRCPLWSAGSLVARICMGGYQHENSCALRHCLSESVSICTMQCCIVALLHCCAVAHLRAVALLRCCTMPN